eukprot:m.102068 g.102068  ORF g.102068 m.102068 type:complete len:75 (+) comp13758_c0_seq2:1073-1297(+)
MVKEKKKKNMCCSGFPYGTCTYAPVIQCVWHGKHELPFRGIKMNPDVNATVRHFAYSDIAWHFMEEIVNGWPFL